MGRMARFTKDQVKHLGHLVRIQLSDDEADQLKNDLNVISNSVSHVHDVATADVPPTANPVPLEAPLRSDVPAKTLDRKEILAQAPKSEAGQFVAPRILGGK